MAAVCVPLLLLLLSSWVRKCVSLLKIVTLMEVLILVEIQKDSAYQNCIRGVTLGCVGTHNAPVIYQLHVGSKSHFFIESVVFLLLKIENSENVIYCNEFRENILIICILCMEKGIEQEIYRYISASTLIIFLCLLYHPLVAWFSLCSVLSTVSADVFS